MKFFFVNTLGQLGVGYCVVCDPPDGMGPEYQRMARGTSIARTYPRAAKIHMDERHPGIKVGDLVANTRHYLIASDVLTTLIAEATPEASIEYLPIVLVNHKGKDHKASLTIINPLGALDCLAYGESEIEYLDEPGDDYNGAVVGVDRFVLSKNKLASAPALFRVKEEPYRYVVNETLATRISSSKLRNVVLDPIEVSARE